MEISKTDLQKAIAYLDDAYQLYTSLPQQALSVEGRNIPLLRLLRILPRWGVAKYHCRAHMIKQLTEKLKSKL